MPRLSNSTGIAALPVVLITGGIIMEIVIALAVVAALGSSNSLSLRAGNDALMVARGGANDAMIKVLRNKDFSSGGYAVTMDSKTATVTVTRDQPAVGQTTIVSTATIIGRQKTIKLIVDIDPTSGQVGIVSLGEI